MVVDHSERMSNFFLSVYEILVKECSTAILINDMDISCHMIFSQPIDKDKLKERSREVEKARTSDSDFYFARLDVHGRSIS